MKGKLTALTVIMALLAMFVAPLTSANSLTPGSGEPASQRERDDDDDDRRRGRGRLSTPVTGTVTKQDGTQIPFKGTFTVQRFAEQDGKLMAIGRLTGTIGDANRDDDDGDDGGRGLRGIRANNFAGASKLAQSGRRVNQQIAMPAQVLNATCQILNLQLGPLDLNLLGLRVQLNQVNLDVTAEQGRGKLLGNLLCGVANLLNPPNLGGLVTLLNRILRAL